MKWGDLLFWRKPASVSEPLSFNTWLRQNGAKYGVTERSETTYMHKGISFDLIRKDPPLVEVKINMETDQKREDLSVEVMDHYAAYLHASWPDKLVSNYVRWAHSSHEHATA